MMVGFINVFKDSHGDKRLGCCAKYIRVQANEHKLLSYCGLMLSRSGVGG